MRAVADAEARTRRGPRPDPIPARALASWSAHAPWILALAGLGATFILVGGRELGLVACGAGWALLLSSATRSSLRVFCRTLHLVAGVLALGLLRGSEEAGTYVPAAAIIAVSALLTRSFALLVRPEVAPLAGRVPWMFRASLRGRALRFGLAGLLAGVPLAFFGPTLVLRVIGIAMLPLALRTYLLNLLSERAAQAIWITAASIEAVLLAALVSAWGPVGAAWSAVVAESVLFAGAAFVVARRTGVTPLPQLQLGGVACAMVLIVLLTVRGNADFLLLAGIILGVAAGALFWNRKVNS